MTEQERKALQELRRLFALLGVRERALVVRFASRLAAPSEKAEEGRLSQ